MAEFITGPKLADQVYDIIFNAKKQLLIVSPYIKLDEYFKKEVFNKHKVNPELHLIIAFGKNEKNPERSCSREDFEYFKEFKNVSIVYVPNLHAKYYANEEKGIVTSINLYDYSFKNNIEFGVVSETRLIDIGGSKIDKQAWEESMEILGENYAVFIRRPQYKKKLFIMKDYMGSENLLDLTDELLNGNKIEKKSVFDYMTKDYINIEDHKERVTREDYEKQISKESKSQVKGTGKLLSGTALGKMKDKKLRDVREVMEALDLVVDNKITLKGKEAGITHKSNDKGDSWIVYPESLSKLL